MTLAGRYFASVELNNQLAIEDVDSLWAWLISGCAIPRPDQWYPPPSTRLFFRGQGNADNALSNALYRRIAAAMVGTRVRETQMALVERSVISAARREGIGRHMTDGELLAVLQHHGVATRLLDFSLDPLDALYFAVESHDERDGRLFVVYTTSPEMQLATGDEPRLVGLNRGSGERRVAGMRLNRWRRLPWGGAQVGKVRAASNWTWRVSPVQPVDLDPRMRAQSGCFLAGGQVQSYGGMTLYLDGDRIAVDHWQEITTLAVHFQPQSRRSMTRNSAWPATGWTVRVRAAWKPELRKRLATWGPSPCDRDAMYPPIEESVRLLSHVINATAAELA